MDSERRVIEGDCRNETCCLGNAILTGRVCVLRMITNDDDYGICCHYSMQWTGLTQFPRVTSISFFFFSGVVAAAAAAAVPPKTLISELHLPLSDITNQLEHLRLTPEICSSSSVNGEGRGRTDRFIHHLQQILIGRLIGSLYLGCVMVVWPPWWWCRVLSSLWPTRGDSCSLWNSFVNEFPNFKFTLSNWLAFYLNFPDKLHGLRWSIVVQLFYYGYPLPRYWICGNILIDIELNCELNSEGMYNEYWYQFPELNWRSGRMDWDRLRRT